MNRGLTVVELSIVIFLIGLITALVLPNYLAGDKSLALQRSAHQLTQDLRRAKEMAMSLREYDCGEKVLTGYGIELGEDNDYYLVAMCNNEARHVFSPELGKVIKMELEEHVVIQSASFNLVYFIPPDPVTKIDGGDIVDRVEIVLALGADANKTKIISINKAGLIYVE